MQFGCRGKAEFLAPVDSGAIAPEELKVVEVAGVGVEDVNDDVDAVDENPAGGFVAGDLPGLEAHGFAKVAGFVDDGAHLAGRGAGGDDEELGDRRTAAKIEQDDIFAAGVGGELCGGEGETVGLGLFGGVLWRGVVGGGNGGSS